MQHIQDKEFDRLFKERFEGAEIEPSANLWDNIEKGLRPKRKRFVPVYWMAAAVVAAVLTAGLIFFNQKEERIPLQAPLAVTEQPKPAEQKDTVQGEKEAEPTVAAEVRQPAGRSAFAKVKLTVAAKGNDRDTLNNFVQKNIKAMQPITEIARLTTKPDAVKEDRPKLDEEPVTPQNEVMIASTDMPAVKEEMSNENDQADKKGIRNVGDLINYVVDKVDKREDKLIQFNTDNDDNSSLVGINLGMIKFSHKKHK